MSIPFPPVRGTVQAHNGAIYRAAPLSIRITLCVSRALRKAAGWLTKIADRLDIWARIRSITSGQRHAFDTITLTPIGAGVPLVAVRDARSQVIAIRADKASDKAGVIAGGVR